MSSEYKGKEPDDDVVATSLAKALVKSLGLGETPPAAQRRIAAKGAAAAK